MKWERTRTNTQDLKVRYEHPFLFGSPIGTGFDLELYKQDSTFTETDLRAALHYFLKEKNRLELFLKRKGSNVLAADPSEVKGMDNLADVEATLYGVGVRQASLDHRRNPTRGHRFSLNGAIGNKKVRRGIESNGSERFLHIDAQLNSAFFIPVFNRSTIKLGARSGLLESEKILANERFRIGGMGSLRGFPEQSINASFYSIASVEFRYLLERNSNIFAFFDGSYYEDRSTESMDSDTPYGFGLGTEFETKAGIFTVSYALGSQRGNPIELRSGKVHFGLTSLF